MDTAAVILLALALSLDCFAVSVSAGASNAAPGRLRALQIAVLFGLFHIMMPVAGFLPGERLKALVEAWDHWVAFGLLAFIGLRMIRQAFSTDEEKPPVLSSLRAVITVAFATSIDAFGVGLGYAMIADEIMGPAFLIGTVTALVSYTGFTTGRRLGKLIGNRAELAGGLCLLAIGIKIVIDHTGLWP